MRKNEGFSFGSVRQDRREEKERRRKIRQIVDKALTGAYVERDENNFDLVREAVQHNRNLVLNERPGMLILGVAKQAA